MITFGYKPVNKKGELSLDNISKINIPTEGKAFETFTLIVNTAERLFCSNGYLSTSIRDIANHANIAIGSIYRYFESKYVLYSYILNKYQKLIKSHIKDSIRFCKTRYEIEKEGLRAWLQFVRNHQDIYKLIWESLFIEQELFEKYYLTYGESYAKALKKDNEQLKIDDPENVAYILIGLANFLGIKLLVKKEMDDATIDKMVETTMQIFKDGLFVKFGE